MIDDNINNLWVIIPARSGSKGILNKNIAKINGKPLIYYTIEFAKKLKFVDKIFLSTDSEEYVKIAANFGIDTPFLRSKKASLSKAMEEDVLLDIQLKCLKHNISPPKSVLWLRPTHPLRSLEDFNKAYNLFIKNKKKSVCIVTETDGRIFYEKSKKLIPIVDGFKKKSMIRRQDCTKFYKIFSGEFFKFPRKYNPKFLGNNPHFIEQPSICAIDIDTIYDLNYLEYVIKNNDEYRKFLHGN